MDDVADRKQVPKSREKKVKIEKRLEHVRGGSDNQRERRGAREKGLRSNRKMECGKTSLGKNQPV